MTQHNEYPGYVLWMTGLSGAGKTTIALLLEQELKARGCNFERLDGDVVRESLTRDLGFSKEDRDKNIERCLLYTSPSPRDRTRSRMPSSA